MDQNALLLITVVLHDSGNQTGQTIVLIVCTNYVAGFLGYPQPGGGMHPPIPSEGGLGEVLWQLG